MRLKDYDERDGKRVWLSAFALLPLHSPGCNDPNEICSPHPDGIAGTVRYGIENPEVLFAATGIVAIGIATTFLVQRYRGESK